MISGIGSVSQFELHKKYKEALDKGRYLITITSLDLKEGKLNHYINRKNFPVEDVIPTLEHFAKRYFEEEKDEEGTENKK